MILGRNAALWAGLVQAVLNFAACALVVYLGQPLTADAVGLFAAANALGVVIVGLIANEVDPTAQNLTRWGVTVPTVSAAGLRRIQELSPTNAGPLDSTDAPGIDTASRDG